jgi:ActR/RegA family two-component response regulator
MTCNRVILIDDEPGVLRALERVLRREPVQVTTTASPMGLMCTFRSMVKRNSTSTVRLSHSAGNAKRACCLSLSISKVSRPRKDPDSLSLQSLSLR